MDVDFHKSAVSAVNQTTLSSDAGTKRGNPTILSQAPHQSQTRPDNNYQPQMQNNIPTPVKWAKLELWLEGYSDLDKDFLTTGYRYGFQLGFDGPNCPQDSPNLPSAFQHDKFVSQNISDELNKGRLGGPFATKPFSNLKLSLLGIFTKKNPGEFRMIHHLSFLRNSGASINENIAEEFISVSYASIQDAISKIKTLGKGCLLAKTDVRSALRIVPIHPSNYPLLGFS